MTQPNRLRRSRPDRARSPPRCGRKTRQSAKWSYSPRRGNSLGVGGRPVQHNVVQPIAGGLEADLLEAEVIHMQHRYTAQRGFVLAVAESEKVVNKKQFHRANYYMGKT